MAHDGALRLPQDEPLPDFLIDVEEAELAAELAVVALFRLLEALEVFVELGLVLEGGAVDALQLRVLVVALVEGAGDAHELEGLAVAGARHVRAGAKIPEVAILVERDLLALGDVIQQVDLELARGRAFAQACEAPALGERQRLLAADLDLLEGLVLLHDLLHLGLDLLEIVRGDAVLELEVVVESVLDRRTGRELGVRPDPQDRGGHDVGAGVPEPLQVGHLAALFQGFSGVFGFFRHGSGAGIFMGERRIYNLKAVGMSRKVASSQGWISIRLSGSRIGEHRGVAQLG